MRMPRDALAQDLFANANDYSLQLNRWFLKPIGAWPRSGDTSATEKAMSGVLIIACYLLIAFTVIPCAFYLWFEDHSMQVKLKALGPMTHWFVGGLNYSSLLMNSKEIQRCVRHMEIDWRTIKGVKDRQLMLHSAKLGRYAAMFCAFTMQGGVFAFTIITTMTKVVIYIGNETVATHLLPCPPYKNMIDTTRSPMNEIILITQFLSCFIVNSITVGACSLAAVFAMHACGQLNVLILWLNELVDDSGEKRVPYRKRMARIVGHHLRALSFISYIEDVMNKICLVELLGCTLDMCMLGYYTVTEWDDHDLKTLLTYVVIFTSMSFNIFTFCYIGEILTEQCKKVGESAYMTEWYFLPHKNALELIFIISRSHVITKITAGKLVHLSVATFGSVIKTTVAYVNMLRTMTP